MAKQVIIEISPAGNVKADAQGFKGVECEKVTEQIELVLGGAAQKKSKPERFMPASAGPVVNKRTF